MKTLRLKNMLLTSAILSTLAACGGGGGYDGAPSSPYPAPAPTPAPVPAPAPAPAEDTSGQVVNSYITGATVTLDLNDDGICAAGEPQATTGANGSYRFAAAGSHLVCATGGTNTVTGLAFVGRLTAPPKATVVTPLTTLVVAQATSSLPAPTLNKAAPLSAAAVAAAQTAIMAQLSLPASSPVLTTDPVAQMTKAGATAADARLEQTNAAVQVMLQQVAASMVGSANLAPSASLTNEAFGAAASALQATLTASGAAAVDLPAASSAATRNLISAMAAKAVSTAKSNPVLLAASANFGTISPTSFASVVAASPVADLVNSVARASVASLTTKGGAETVALSSNQVPDLAKQLSSLMTDNADAGSVSVTTLTTLTTTLLPSTGAAVTQAAATAAVNTAITTINAALPAGRTALVSQPVTVLPPVTIPQTQAPAPALDAAPTSTAPTSTSPTAPTSTAPTSTSTTAPAPAPTSTSTPTSTAPAPTSTTAPAPTSTTAPAPAPAPAPAADTAGQVINSYISGATVTLDQNDDGICAAGEPQVTTGTDGSYRFAATGVHMVCATGGTNTVTGLAFVGRLTAPPMATVVTPLTTLVVAQVTSSLPAPTLNKAAPLSATAIAAAQTSIMAQLSLPTGAPILTTDPVAQMKKAGATAADTRLEQTNAAIQVMMQQVATSLVGSANLAPSTSASVTNEAFAAAAGGLQAALNASGAAAVDLPAATTATTRNLVSAMAAKAVSAARTNQVLLAASPNFGTISPTSFAAVVAASPVAELVNAVARASVASLTTRGGAETVALSSSQIPQLARQLSSMMSDSADTGSASASALSKLAATLLPATGVAVTQFAANTAVNDATAAINAAMPVGRSSIVAPSVVALPPVEIPK